MPLIDSRMAVLAEMFSGLRRQTQLSAFQKADATIYGTWPSQQCSCALHCVLIFAILFPQVFPAETWLLGRLLGVNSDVLLAEDRCRTTSSRWLVNPMLRSQRTALPRLAYGTWPQHNEPNARFLSHMMKYSDLYRHRQPRRRYAKLERRGLCEAWYKCS